MASLGAYVAKEASAAAAWSDTSWHTYADYQTTVMGAGVTYVNAMSSPRIQYTTAVADANKTYAIAMENIAVAKANASASLEVAQVAAAEAATFSGVMPKPRSAYGSFLDDANQDRDDAIGTDLYRFHDESNFMHYAA